MIYDHNHAWYLNLWCLFLAPATLAMSKRLPKAIKIDQGDVYVHWSTINEYSKLTNAKFRDATENDIIMASKCCAYNYRNFVGDETDIKKIAIIEGLDVSNATESKLVVLKLTSSSSSR